MSDVQTMVIEPLTKFVKDSTYLVKKCTKPDHKGKSDLMFACLLALANAPVYPTVLSLHRRIRKSCSGNGSRIFADGLHRVLR
jgi:hypothetical protein